MSKVEWIKFTDRAPTTADLPIWTTFAGVTDLFCYSIPTGGSFTAWAKADIPEPYNPPKIIDYAKAYGELTGILLNLAAYTDDPRRSDYGIAKAAIQAVERALELGHI